MVVIAATNRPETLDPALLRPGRFDRQVEIPLPNRAERAAILGVHVKGRKLGPDVVLDIVAGLTPGFSGADLANLVNEATIVAVRADREVVTAADFSEARDRILLGRREASNALLPDEKHAVAVHEGGHALVAVLSEHADHFRDDWLRDRYFNLVVSCHAQQAGCSAIELYRGDICAGIEGDA